MEISSLTWKLSNYSLQCSTIAIPYESLEGRRKTWLQYGTVDGMVLIWPGRSNRSPFVSVGVLVSNYSLAYAVARTNYYRENGYM